MKKTIIIIFLLINSLIINCQVNYIDYHKGIIKAEMFFLDSNYIRCFSSYDSIFAQYDYLFVRDCMIAAQFAVLANDYPHAFKYLELGVKQGLQLQTIQNNELTKRLITDSKWNNFINKYDSLLNIYFSHINWQVREKCLMMFYEDQEVRRIQYKWFNRNFRFKKTEKKCLEVNRIHISILRNIINEYGYPGCKIVGTGNDTIPAPVTWNCNLSSNLANIILFHYPDAWDEFNKSLYVALTKGEIHPLEYAVIREYKEQFKVKKEKDKNFYYKIIWQQSKYTDQEIDKHREEIGVLSIKDMARFNKFCNNLLAKNIKFDWYWNPYLWVR